jgi:hypothetical protein
MYHQTCDAFTAEDIDVHTISFIPMDSLGSLVSGKNGAYFEKIEQLSYLGFGFKAVCSL